MWDRNMSTSGPTPWQIYDDDDDDDDDVKLTKDRGHILLLVLARIPEAQPKEMWIQCAECKLWAHEDRTDDNYNSIPLTHCGRVTQIYVSNTVKLGTSASSP